MGFLSGLLKVVGVVAAVATGGLLAGAVIALAAFAGPNSTIGKFFQSGWGKGLLAAVTVGSAIASVGATALASAGQTSTGFLENFVQGAKTFVSALEHPIDAATAALGGDSTAWAADKAASGVATQAPELAANTAQVAADQTAQTAASTGAGSAAPATDPGQLLASGSNANATAAGAASGPAAAQQAVQPVADLSKTPMPALGPVEQGSSGVGGMLSKAAGGALDFAKSKGGGTLIGNVLQGYASGAANRELAQQAFQNSNWGNNQWLNPKNVTGLKTAAQQPITVPQGYLSRAQAVQNLVSGNQPAPQFTAPNPATTPAQVPAIVKPTASVLGS